MLVCRGRTHSVFCMENAFLLVDRTVSLWYRGCLLVGIDDIHSLVEMMLVCLLRMLVCWYKRHAPSIFGMEDAFLLVVNTVSLV